MTEVFDEFTFWELEIKTKTDIENLFNSLNDTISKDIKNDVDILDTAEYIFAEQISKAISNLIYLLYHKNCKTTRLFFY